MEGNTEDDKQSGDSDKINEMNPQDAEKPHSTPRLLPGEISQYGVGSLQYTSTDITLQVKQEYTTDISEVFYMSPSKDCVWISDGYVLQKVQPDVDKLKIMSNLDIDICGVAVTLSNDLLLIPRGQSVLKQISNGTDKVTDTNYCVASLRLTAVHVTSDGTVVVGARDFGELFPATGRRAVISMDTEGTHNMVYEYDRNNQSIFTLPSGITSTHSSNICVVDALSSDGKGRVVVLGQDEDIINEYTGHPEVNTGDEASAFSPSHVVTTPSDNVIISDIFTLHILNHLGYPMTYINTWDKGIIYLYTIAFTTGGNVYIGCTRSKTSSEDTKAKLYEVKYTEA